MSVFYFASPLLRSVHVFHSLGISCTHTATELAIGDVGIQTWPQKIEYLISVLQYSPFSNTPSHAEFGNRNSFPFGSKHSNSPRRAWLSVAFFSKRCYLPPSLKAVHSNFAHVLRKKTWWSKIKHSFTLGQNNNPAGVLGIVFSCKCSIVVNSSFFWNPAATFSKWIQELLPGKT